MTSRHTAQQSSDCLNHVSPTSCSAAAIPLPLLLLRQCSQLGRKSCTGSRPRARRGPGRRGGAAGQQQSTKLPVVSYPPSPRRQETLIANHDSHSHTASSSHEATGGAALKASRQATAIAYALSESASWLQAVLRTPTPASSYKLVSHLHSCLSSRWHCLAGESCAQLQWFQKGPQWPHTTVGPGQDPAGHSCRHCPRHSASTAVSACSTGANCALGHTPSFRVGKRPRKAHDSRF